MTRRLLAAGLAMCLLGGCGDEAEKELDRLATEARRKAKQEVAKAKDKVRKAAEEAADDARREAEQAFEKARREAERLLKDDPPDEDRPRVGLHVPYVAQGNTLWCGLACTCMLLRYHGQDETLWEMADEKDWSAGQGFFGIDLSIGSNTIGSIGRTVASRGLRLSEWYDWGGIQQVRPDRQPGDVFAWMRGHLDRRRPILMALGGEGHAVLAVDYEISDGCRYVYLHDPSGALVNKLRDTHQPLDIPADIRVPFAELYARQQGLTHKTHMAAVTRGAPAPRVGTLQLGRFLLRDGRWIKQLGHNAHGVTGVRLITGTGRGGNRYGGLQMHDGLRWRSLGSGEQLGDVCEAPPETWVLGPDAKLVCQRQAGFGVTDPYRPDATYTLRLRVDQGAHQVQDEAQANPTGGQTAVDLSVPLGDLPDDVYNVTIQVSGPGGTSRHFLPALKLDTP